MRHERGFVEADGRRRHAGSAGNAAADRPLMNCAALQTGAMAMHKNGQTCYRLGNTWFQPAFGANGVHYTVVAAP
jgi:hypothetical protein